MKKSKIILSMLIIALLSSLSLPSFAVDQHTGIAGYIWNPLTGELKGYTETPESCLPPITLTGVDLEPYTANVTTRSLGRAFISYSPKTYTYNYTSDDFKIGMVRVDNSNNRYSPADLTFTVDKSGSCSIAFSGGAELGGEVNAIFSKAQAKFSAEVTGTATWSKGTSVGTGSQVPAGKIGRVTAYVVGIYSSGSAIYRVLNTTTDETWDETKGIGALIPTTNAWNLKVEIPST